MQPFFDQYLKDGAPKADTPPVFSYQTGTNKWQRLDQWPLAAASAPIYLKDGFRLGFDKPAGGAQFDEYVADPAKPVPFVQRPVRMYDAAVWKPWLVSDQRSFSDRTDVLTYVTEPLRAPLQISGQPMVNLFASTSGTDADWVVKLIDVYPDEVASQPELGGYQLGIAMDIFRGRYRQGLDKPLAITGRQGRELPLRAAERRPRVPAGPPRDGADPVELVPAVRPQSADLRAEYFLRQGGRLPQGDPARLSRAGHGEHDRTAGGRKSRLVRRTVRQRTDDRRAAS